MVNYVQCTRYRCNAVPTGFVALYGSVAYVKPLRTLSHKLNYIK